MCAVFFLCWDYFGYNRSNCGREGDCEVCLARCLYSRGGIGGGVDFFPSDFQKAIRGGGGKGVWEPPLKSLQAGRRPAVRRAGSSRWRTGARCARRAASCSCAPPAARRSRFAAPFPSLSLLPSVRCSGEGPPRMRQCSPLLTSFHLREDVEGGGEPGFLTPEA